MSSESSVWFADHPTDATKLCVVTALSRKVLDPALERAEREGTPKAIARYRAEDLALHAAYEAIAQARRAVQDAEARAASGKTLEQEAAEKRALAEADVLAKAASAPAGDTVADAVPERDDRK